MTLSFAFSNFTMYGNAPRRMRLNGNCGCSQRCKSATSGASCNSTSLALITQNRASISPLCAKYAKSSKGRYITQKTFKHKFRVLQGAVFNKCKTSLRKSKAISRSCGYLLCTFKSNCSTVVLAPNVPIEITNH